MMILDCSLWTLMRYGAASSTPSQSRRTSAVCSPSSGGAVHPCVMSDPEYFTAGPMTEISP